MEEGIKLKNVTFSYNIDNIVLQDISLLIKKGSFLGITGINGSGKSTLTYLFNGLIPHFIRGRLSGEVRVDGISTSAKSVAFFAGRVGMVFQNPDYSLFNLTVAEELGFGLDNLKLDNKDERIRRALDIVGLKGFENRDPQTLSLGQKQKVSLASVLSLETDYLVLDEPTAMLDYKSSLELYHILKNLNQKRKTIIVVEHDTDFLRQYAEEVVIIDKGKIIRNGTSDKVLKQKELLIKLGIKVPL